MGEIKSTLDLVMERTRHLSLSDEEKKQQKRTDLKKRLQGLLQQYADSALDIESLQQRISKLQEEFETDDPQIIKEAILGRIAPGEENQLWLDLVPFYAPEAQKPVEELIAAYQDKQLTLLQTGTDRQHQTLLQTHNIYGSAVIPNPQKEPNYRQELSNLKSETQAKMNAIARQA